MKILKHSLPIVIACLSAFSVAHADFESDFTKSVAKSIKYVNTHPNEVWPEFSLSDKPTVLYFTEDANNIYAYHYIPVHQGWKLLNVENTPAYFRDDLNLTKGYGASYLDDVDGQQAYVYVPWTVEDQDQLSFHMLRMLGSRFYDSVYWKQISETVWSKFYNSDYDSFNQLENIKLAYLSDVILKNYLQTNDIEVLKDYAAVEYRRSDISNKKSRDFEWGLMVLDGPENYVGLKSQNLNDKEYVQAILNDQEYQNYCGSIKNPLNIRVCMYLRHDFRAEALGYALDKVGYDGWKNSLTQNQHKQLSMEDALEKSLNMSRAEMAQRTEDSKTHYHYDQISEQIDVVMKPYLAEMAQLKEQYAKSLGVEVRFRNFDFCNVIHFYDSNLDERNLFVLSDRLYLDRDFSVTNSCKNSDKSSTNTFALTHVPLHYTSWWNSEFMDGYDHQFKISSDTPLIIDGKQETAGAFVAAHKVKVFNSLQIKNAEVDIVLNEKGVIDGSTDRLVFHTFKDSKLKLSKKDKNKVMAERYLKFREMVKNMRRKG